MLLLPDPVTAVEPEAIEPVPEPSVRESDALAGPMAEFGTAEVISWLETVEGLAESELVAIKAKLVKEEFIGQDLIDLTVRSLSRLLRDAGAAETAPVLLAARDKHLALMVGLPTGADHALAAATMWVPFVPPQTAKVLAAVADLVLDGEKAILQNMGCKDPATRVWLSIVSAKNICKIGLQHWCFWPSGRSCLTNNFMVRRAPQSVGNCGNP